MSRFIKGETSSKRTISARVFQGSGLSPPSFIICASGLHLVNEENRMAKCADKNLPYGGCHPKAYNYGGN